MKNFKRFVLASCLLVFAVAVTAATLLISGCKPDKGQVLEGTYYADVDGNEYNVGFDESYSFTFTVAGDNREGDYYYDGTEITLSFTDGEEGEELSASFAANGNLVFTYDGVSYSMLPKVTYTVTYDLDGGIGTASDKVVNGRTVGRPSNPAKSGYGFAGWYTDEAFSRAYDFDVPVTADITLYARYIQLTSEEFVISFDAASAHQTYENTTTAGGHVYALPEPEGDGEFLGWWISDYNDASKLTAMVQDGQEIKQNVTLFAVWASAAPAVSVNADGVSWTGGSSANYSIVITGPDGNSVLSRNGNGTSVSFNFDDVAEGDYVVELTVGGNTTTAYYRNKALARVSLFSVEDSAIVFNEVDNATEYYLTYTCGTAGHSHTDVLLTDNYYDFADCDMAANGMLFYVTAKAEGYAESVSDVFVFERHLDGVSGLSVDANFDIAEWDEVEGATSYLVEVTVDEVTQSFYVTENSFSLQNYHGALTVSVTPVAHGYNSPAAAECEYNKTRLATPSNIVVSGYTVTWDEVEGATSYLLVLGGTTYTAIEPTYTFTQAQIDASENLLLTITAVASAEANSSLASAQLDLSGVGTPVYENGVVSWNPVMGATGYGVRVNGGEETLVEGSSLAVTLTQEGANLIEVRSYQNNTPSQWYSVTVTAAKLTYDNNDGYSALTEVYLAEGDEIPLPDATRTGYDLIGWFTAPVNGMLITENTIFSSDLRLYAQWAARSYNVTLVVYAEDGEFAAGSLVDGVYTYTQEVTFGESFKLPTPTTTNGAKAFVGWYTAAAGGLQYTNHLGESTLMWPSSSDMSLYARWEEAFRYVTITNPYDSDSLAYSVYHGTGIDYLSEVTVPAMYDGESGLLPVTTIDGSCFASCTELNKVNIPDSIYSIYVGIDGSNSTGSAFYGCTDLREVNIYDASEQMEGNYERRYWSEDGVLYFNNPNTGVELCYVPRGKTGTLTIADGVQVIPIQAFRYTTVTEVVIPASVTSIEYRAFYTSDIVKFTFTEPKEGEDALPLTLGEQVFYGMSITSIDLPSRITSFNLNIFDSCDELEAINITGTGGTFSSYDGVVLTDGGRTIYYCPIGKSGSFRVPGTVDTIGANAFEDCDNLTEVIISGGVTMIESEAFANCATLSSVIFEGTAVDPDLTIGASAFYNCDDLLNIVLPPNLTILEENAFGGIGSSTNRVTVTVNATTTNTRPTISYSNGAFAATGTTATSYVGTLYIGANVPEIDISGVFGSVYLTTLVVDPANTNYALDNDGVLFNYDMTSILYYPADRQGEYSIPDTVTYIGSGVFRARTGLTRIVINEHITALSDYAFYGCTGLVEVYFEPTPAGETAVPLTIGENTFYGCTNLATINLPTRLTSIGGYAFRNCDDLISIVIPEGVTYIGQAAFYDCDYLVSVSLPSTLAEMGTYAESDLTSEAVYDNINVFRYCDNLATLTVASGNSVFTVIDGALFGLNEEGVPVTLYFSPSRNPGNNGTVTIPATVSAVKDRAFYDAKVITSVIFEDRPDDSAFTLGDAVFGATSSGTSTLETVDLPGGLTTISRGMFKNATIKAVVIPNTVTLIEPEAFYGCVNLSSVIFEEGGTQPLVIADATSATSTTVSYSYSPFYRCSSLKELIFPERLTEIGQYAFGYTNNSSGYSSNLEKVHFPSTLTSIGDNAFRYATHLTDVTFADGGTEDLAIGTYAFYYNSSLGNITLPGNLVSLGKYAFGYSGLTSVFIPAKVTALDYAFYYCRKLASVEFAEDSLLTEIGTYSFYYCSALTSLNLNALTSLESIGSRAFSYTTLTSIEIPASVTLIDNYAFAYASSLDSVTFLTENVAAAGEEPSYKSHLEEIGLYAFQSTALTSFSFPETVAEDLVLGNNLFNSCRDLRMLHLSTSVTDLGNALAGCSTITSISIANGNNSYSTDPSGAPLLLDTAGTEIVMAYGPMADEAGVYVIPEGFVSIANYAFSGQNGIKSLTIPASVQSIGDYAFRYCRMLEEVSFAEGSSLTTVGDYAFQGCFSLKEIAFPQTVSSLGGYIFRYDFSLEKVTMPATVTTIGNYMFQYNYSLTDVNVPAVSGDGYTQTTGTYMFGYCTSLETVRMPADMKVIPNYMFYNCSSFTGEGIDFSSLEVIGNYAFYNCSNLKSIDLSSVETLGTYAFRYAGISELTIPRTLTAITSATATAPAYTTAYTFADCTNLTSVILHDDLITIGAYAFYNCTNLTTVKYMTADGELVGEDNAITLPEGLLNLGRYAFSYCAAEEAYIPSTVELMGGYVFQECPNLKYAEVLASTCAYKTSSTGSLTSTTYIFDNCPQLERVVINDKIDRLGSYMFNDCVSLATVDIYDPADGTTTSNPVGTATMPSGMTYSTPIGSYTFSNTAIRTVIIPEGLTVVGGTNTTTSATSSSHAFAYNPQLEKVILHDGVTRISGGVFRGCPNLKTVQYTDSEGAIHGEEGVVTLPESVIIVGNYAFGSGRMTGTTDPETDIASGIEKVVMLSTAKMGLGNYLFQDCKELVEIEMHTSNIATSTTSKTAPTYLFDGCSALETVIVGDGLTAVPNYAFRNCESLTTILLYNATSDEVTGMEGQINLPSGLKTIGTASFMGTESITSLDLSACTSLESIGVDAFNGAGFTSITIPATVDSIGGNAFPGITVTAASDSTHFFNQSGALVSSSGVITVVPASLSGEWTVPAGATVGGYSLHNSNISTLTLTTDQIASYSFSYFSGAVVITLGSATTIPASAFWNYSGSSVTLPEGLTAINNATFEGASAIKSITIPEGVESIGTEAFLNCTSLTSVTIPSSVTSIGNYAFDGCTSLSSVNFGEGASYTIGSYAFRNTTALKQIDITGATSISSYGFSNSGLTEITIPRTITRLVGTTTSNFLVSTSSYAFNGCASLETVILHDEFEVLGAYTFRDCSSLKTVKYATADGQIVGEDNTVTLPDSLTILGNYNFSGTAVENVTLPVTLQNVGTYMFQNATSLKTVTIYTETLGYMSSSTATTVTYSSYLFDGCTQLETVYLNDGITTTGTYMFRNCTSLKNIYTFSVDEQGNMIYDQLAEGVADLSNMTTVATSFLEGCTSIKQVILNDELVTISASAFESSGLTSINIPESVTTINAGAFSYCPIERIVIPGSVSSMYAAFEGWTADQTIVIELYDVDGSCSWTYTWIDTEATIIFVPASDEQ